MFRLIAFFTALLSVAAFLPATRVARSSTLKMVDFTKEPGLADLRFNPPAPLQIFDPLGLAKDKETFDTYRASEVKHGRVCQLAVLGYIVPEVFRVS